ncbi:Guanine nucleotide-binding protein subunit beta-like protein [Hondaea fermentalgiana]|uniref:Guanine nucleotide-binding protein subunit beta-like protein n=1 Tax=Hondaea fermentalgiana TaxID=2315210 RepID=A0A2R5GI22_9STRA|nr:Guanine nucleotide-binding protein subunit beta-like protein [Hondaea fermentalgiana]|eukprot:GBG28303.1 Guanine nucleotide-binding protein subunit beta-like protein [Hondaea fermentalgiana]
MGRQAWTSNEDDGTFVEVYVSYASHANTGAVFAEKAYHQGDVDYLSRAADMSEAEGRVRKIVRWFARHPELNISLVSHDGMLEAIDEGQEEIKSDKHAILEHHGRRIDRCQVFLSCVSDGYLRNVPRNPQFFRCASEFRHAAWSKPACMVQIALDKAAMKTQDWPQIMRVVLKGNTLHAWPKDDQFDMAMLSLAERIRIAAKNGVEFDPEAPWALLGCTHTFDALAEVRRKALEYLPGSQMQKLNEIRSLIEDRDSRTRVSVLTGPQECGKSVLCAAICLEKGVCNFTPKRIGLGSNGSSSGGSIRRISSSSSVGGGSGSSRFLGGGKDTRGLGGLGGGGGSTRSIGSTSNVGIPRISKLVARKLSRAPPWTVGAVHFFRACDAQGKDVRICLRSVAHQMCSIVPGLREELPTNLEWIDDPQALFSCAIAGPCSRVDPPPERIVVILDGINEADPAHRDILMRLILQSWARETPGWLHLLVSLQTPGPLTRTSLERAGHTILELDDALPYVEAAKYFGSILEPFVANKSDIDTVLPMLQLHGASSYLFGEIFRNRLFARSPEGGLPATSLMSKIPLGLDGLLRDSYHSLLQAAFFGERNALNAFLSVLCAAREPVPVEYILVLISSEEAKRLLAVPTRIIIHEASTLRFVHSFVPEFFVDEARAGVDAVVNLEEGHRRLAHICGLMNDDFASRHTLYHLAQAGQRAAALELLDDFIWVKQAISCSGTDVSVAHRYERLGALVQDCVSESLLMDSDAAQLMRKAMGALSQDVDELAGQIIARLPEKHALHASMTESFMNRSWLKPMRLSLEHPRGPLLEILETNSCGVCCVAMEEYRAFAGCEDGAIWVWQVNSGRLLGVWRGHRGHVTGIAIGARLVVSGSQDATVRAWDFASGRPIYVLGGHLAPVRSVAIGQGIIAAGSDDTTVRVWSALSFEPIFLLVGHLAPVSSLALDGTRLVSGAWDLTVRVWDMDTGREVGVLHGSEAPVLSVATQDDLVVAVTADHSLRAWSTPTGAQLYKVAAQATQVALSDGRLFVAGERGLIQVWDAQTCTHIRDMVGHGGEVTSLFPLDGRVILSGSVDGSVRVWDAHAAAAGAIQEHEGKVRCLVAYGDRVVSGGEDGVLRVWDLRTALELDDLGFENVDVVGMSSPGSQQSYQGEPEPIQALDFWETLVVAASGATVSVWDIALRERLYLLRGHNAPVTKVSIEERGATILSASSDRSVRVWDTNSGQLRHILRRHCAPVTSLSLNGSTLATGGDDAIVCLWDIKTGHSKFAVDHNERVRSVVFRGKYLAVGLFNGSIHVWDATEGRILVVLQGHQAPVVDLTLSQTGSPILVSRDCWGYTCFWDLLEGVQISQEQADVSTWNAVSFAHGRLGLGGDTAGFSIDVPFTCALNYNGTVVAGDRNGVVHFLEVVHTQMRPRIMQRRP